MSLQDDAAISTDDGWHVSLNFNHAKSAFCIITLLHQARGLCVVGIALSFHSCSHCQSKNLSLSGFIFAGAHATICTHKQAMTKSQA